MTVTTARQAMLLSPWRFLLSAWPWRCLAYLLSGAILGALTAAAIIAMVVAGAVLAIALIGFAFFAACLLSGIVVARWERVRLRLVDERPTFDPHADPDQPGLRAWLLTRLRERSTWRELGYAVVSAAALCWIDLGVLAITVGLVGSVFVQSTIYYVTWYWYLFSCGVGVVLIPLALYVITGWATARAEITRAVVSPDDLALGRRLSEVTASRAALSDAFDVERRRIESDLHDGAQQRLVALNVALGMARLDVPEGSRTAEQLEQAQQQTRLALEDVRNLIRGIHPQVLTERGLREAVRDVAGRTAAPVTVDIDLSGRAAADVESAAYFCVAEALTNIDRHADASRASVTGRVRAGVLTLEIADDGRGGAVPRPQSGLAGLHARLAVVGGTLSVSSPTGGPTSVHVEVPWAFE
ncbi:sensor histidine kinase [Solicola gregarius]|uniref:histidine kinase n=1 Tax=Solicola gregarius TaxID=2908642 RepID=A0AA46TMF5_9ACTN|nr:sensor histidine kinase [Solicola gregarius]UYM07622.1 sensor domain-containing protein [Solicola gregarius]